MFRRRSGQDTDVAASLYQFPPGTDPSWLMPYQVQSTLYISIIVFIATIVITITVIHLFLSQSQQEGRVVLAADTMCRRPRNVKTEICWQLRYLFICTYLSSSSGSSQHRTAQRAQLSWLTSTLNETSIASVITSSLAVSGVARNLIGGGYTFQLQSLQFQNLC